jgi:hypothetical protein
MSKKKNRKRVTCKGCAFLILTNKLPPGCTAFAYFKSSALQKRHDLLNVKESDKINQHNNCKKKRVVSLRGFFMRKWLKHNYADLIKKGGLKFYGSKTRKYLKEKKGKN